MLLQEETKGGVLNLGAVEYKTIRISLDSQYVIAENVEGFISKHYKFLIKFHVNQISEMFTEGIISKTLVFRVFWERDPVRSYGNYSELRAKVSNPNRWIETIRKMKK